MSPSAELSPVRRRSLHRRIARALGRTPRARSGQRQCAAGCPLRGAGMPEQAIRCCDSRGGGETTLCRRRSGRTSCGARLRFAASSRSGKTRPGGTRTARALGPSRSLPRATALPKSGKHTIAGWSLSRRLATTRTSVLVAERRMALPWSSAANSRNPRKSGAGLHRGGASRKHVRPGDGRPLSYGRQPVPSWTACGVPGTHRAGGIVRPATLRIPRWLSLPAVTSVCSAGRIWHICYGIWRCRGGGDQGRRGRCSGTRARPPFALAIALDYAAMLGVFRQVNTVLRWRGPRRRRQSAGKHGFAYYLAMAEILAGWAIGMESDPAAGLARLRLGLDALKATGAELRLPFYYGLLGEVCGRAGQHWRSAGRTSPPDLLS